VEAPLDLPAGEVGVEAPLDLLAGEVGVEAPVDLPAGLPWTVRAGSAQPRCLSAFVLC
jgi:hypothetical protein